MALAVYWVYGISGVIRPEEGEVKKIMRPVTDSTVHENTRARNIATPPLGALFNRLSVACVESGHYSFKVTDVFIRNLI